MRTEDRIRRLIAQEAARIMYEEGVSELCPYLESRSYEREGLP